MKGFIPTAENHGLTRGAPPASRIMIGLHFSSQQPGIDEVNFWQPGGRSRFRRLNPGEPFLFKLHAPYNFIVGGGFFVNIQKPERRKRSRKNLE